MANGDDNQIILEIQARIEQAQQQIASLRDDVAHLKETASGSIAIDTGELETSVQSAQQALKPLQEDLLTLVKRADEAAAGLGKYGQSGVVASEQSKALLAETQALGGSFQEVSARTVEIKSALDHANAALQQNAIETDRADRATQQFVKTAIKFIGVGAAVSNELQALRASMADLKREFPGLADGLERVEERIESFSGPVAFMRQLSIDVARAIREVKNELSDLPDITNEQAQAFEKLDATLEDYRDLIALLADQDLARWEQAMDSASAKVFEQEDALKKAMEAAEEYAASLVGSREALEEQSSALVNGVDLLRSNGQLTREVANEIRQHAEQLIADWERFGTAAPESIHLVLDEMKLLAPASQEAATSVETLGGAFDQVAIGAEAALSRIDQLLSGIERVQATGPLFSPEALAQLNQMTDELVEAEHLAEAAADGFGESAQEIQKALEAGGRGTGQGLTGLADEQALMEGFNETLVDHTQQLAEAGEEQDAYRETIEAVDLSINEITDDTLKQADATGGLTEVTDQAAGSLSLLGSAASSAADQLERAGDATQAGATGLRDQVDLWKELRETIEETAEAGVKALATLEKAVDGPLRKTEAMLRTCERYHACLSSLGAA